MNNTLFQFLTNSKSIIAIATALSLSGCLEESESNQLHKESDLKIQTYLENNNIEATQSDNGLYYETLIANESGQKPKVGEVMKVKYEMQTLEGKLLESHTADSALVKFDGNAVIPVGFSYGIDVMRKGEKIRCYIPSYLAYNTVSGKDAFGANANFILDIELLDITTEEQVNKDQIDIIEDYLKDDQNLASITPTPSGLYFRTLEEGDGDEAKTYHIATLHYKRKYLDGTLIQETEADKPLEVNLGTNQLVIGFREGVLKMKEGEKALMIMPSEIAFGSSVKIIPESVREELWQEGYIYSLVDAYQIVQYEVELIDQK